MATNFITSHGMIWGEISDTGVTRSYGHDALGSVTETFVNGALENTYRYTPYGSLLAKTGTAPDPSFLWNGGSGYRATGLVNNDFYVRRRHFSRNTAQWTTADPLWPEELAYSYAWASPCLLTDPGGLSPCTKDTPACNLPIDILLCRTAGNDLANLLAQLLQNALKVDCACSITWSGNFIVTLNSACADITALKGTSCALGAKTCQIKKTRTVKCENTNGAFSWSCGSKTCPGKCGVPATSALKVTFPLPSSINWHGAGCNFAMTNVVGQATATGTVAVATCKPVIIIVGTPSSS